MANEQERDDWDFPISRSLAEKPIRGKRTGSAAAEATKKPFSITDKNWSRVADRLEQLGIAPWRRPAAKEKTVTPASAEKSKDEDRP